MHNLFTRFFCGAQRSSTFHIVFFTFFLSFFPVWAEKHPAEDVDSGRNSRKPVPYAVVEAQAASDRAENPAQAGRILAAAGVKTSINGTDLTLSGGFRPTWTERRTGVLPPDRHTTYGQTESGLLQGYVSYRSHAQVRDRYLKDRFYSVADPFVPGRIPGPDSGGFSVGFDAGRFFALSDPVGLLVAGNIPAVQMTIELPADLFNGISIGFSGAFYDLTDPDFLAHSPKTGLSSYSKGEFYLGNDRWYLTAGSGIFRNRPQSAEPDFVIRSPDYPGVSYTVYEGQKAAPLQRVVYHHISGSYEADSFYAQGAVYFQKGKQAFTDPAGNQLYATKQKISRGWAAAARAGFITDRWGFELSGVATSRFRDSVDDTGIVSGFSSLRGGLGVAGGFSSFFLNARLPNQESHGLTYQPNQLPERYLYTDGRAVSIDENPKRYIPDYKTGGIRLGGPEIRYYFPGQFTLSGRLNYADLKEGDGGEGILTLYYQSGSLLVSVTGSAAGYKPSDRPVEPVRNYAEFYTGNAKKVRTKWMSRYTFSARFLTDFL